MALWDIEGCTKIPYSDLKIGAEVGSGAFGTVYKAKWISRAETVAVKVLHAHKFSDEVLAQFTAELRVMQQLRSAYIITLLGVCFEPERLCLITEFAEQRSLFDVLHSDKPLPWKLRARLAAEAARGINHLHQLNILHRDIKSLNILVNADDHAKVADFGLAKAKLESKTTTSLSKHKTVGSIRWAAPEILRLGRHDAACDVFSFGIVLFELCTRELPYPDASDDTICAAVKAGERMKIPDNVPPDFQELITACWSADAAARPNMIAIVLRLDDILARLQQADAPKAIPVASTPAVEYPWTLSASLRDTCSWKEEGGVRLAELDCSVPAQRAQFDALKDQCRDVSVTRVLVVDNPALEARFNAQLLVLQRLCAESAFRPSDVALHQRDLQRELAAWLKPLPGICGFGAAFTGTTESIARKICHAGMVNIKVKDAGSVDMLCCCLHHSLLQDILAPVCISPLKLDMPRDTPLKYTTNRATSEANGPLCFAGQLSAVPTS